MPCLLRPPKLHSASGADSEDEDEEEDDSDDEIEKEWERRRRSRIKSSHLYDEIPPIDRPQPVTILNSDGTIAHTPFRITL